MQGFTSEMQGPRHLKKDHMQEPLRCFYLMHPFINDGADPSNYRGNQSSRSDRLYDRSCGQKRQGSQPNDEGLFSDLSSSTLASTFVLFQTYPIELVQKSLETEKTASFCQNCAFYSL